MIINDLQKRGISVQEDYLLEEELEEMLDYQKTLKRRVNFRKNFLHEFWDRTKPLDTDNPFTHFGMNEIILAIAEEYLGKGAHLYDSNLSQTRVMEKNEERQWSQNWHRDPESKKIMKVLVYLTDVIAGCGPFNYVLESQPSGKLNKVLPQNPTRGTYPEEEDVDRLIPEENIIEVLGKAGTAIFVDTTGLHRGGYSINKSRLMYTATYLKETNTNGLYSIYKNK